MRESGAGVGTGFINATQVSLQKDTPSLGPLQYTTFVRILLRVLGEQVLRSHAERPGQFLHVPAGDSDGRNAAAIATRCAVDLVLDILRDPHQSPLLIIPALQMNPQSEVLVALFLAQTTNLDQVSQHCSSVRRKSTDRRFRPGWLG